MADSTRTVRILAPAKLNLGLRLRGRRPDGYHRLVTVFQTLALSDTLEVQPRPADASDRLVAEGPVPVEVDSDNLVLRALHLLRRTGWSVPPLRIWLHKRIPVAAGLGGGSSDAAALLRMASERWTAGEEAPDLHTLARRLGADVPFFLRGGTALGRGIGDRLEDLPSQKASVLLAVLPGGMSTERAFREVEVSEEDVSSDGPAVTLRENGDETAWRRLDLHNDFSDLLRQSIEGFETIYGALRDVSEYVAPTGSGSTLYALFADDEERNRAHRTLREDASLPECEWIRTRFLSADAMSRPTEP